MKVGRLHRRMFLRQGSAGRRRGYRASRLRRYAGRIAGNGVRTIIVESPDRFSRDLAVQLAGHDHLRKLGVTLIPATAPDFFTEDTPTAVLARQVLGAIAQFDKATTVAKLKAARDRRIAAGEKCSGRKSYAEARPEMVERARQLRRPIQIDGRFRCRRSRPVAERPSSAGRARLKRIPIILKHSLHA